MTIEDAFRHMSDDQLVDALQRTSNPILAELQRRGKRIRIDERNSASGLPIFVRVPALQVVEPAESD